MTGCMVGAIHYGGLDVKSDKPFSVLRRFDVVTMAAE